MRGRPVSRSIRLLAALVTAALAPSPAIAVSCSAASSGVSFGSYDTLDPSPLDSAGDVRVTCDSSVPFTVSLNAGSGPSGARQLSGGSATLNYQLYSDAARTTVWGDDTYGNSVSTSGTDVDLSVYGRIPGQQNVPAGSYSDVLTITISY